MLEVGMKAPDFTLLNQNGEEVSLKDYRGKKVILYFILKTILQDVQNKLVALLKIIHIFKKKALLF